MSATYVYRAELRSAHHGYTMHDIPVTVVAEDAESGRKQAMLVLPKEDHPYIWVLTLISIDTPATVVEQPESGSPATTEVTTG